MSSELVEDYDKRVVSDIDRIVKGIIRNCGYKLKLVVLVQIRYKLRHES